MLLLSAPVLGHSQITLGTNEQASLNTSGGAPDGRSDTPAVAGNGRYLVFRSEASNLVSDDTNAESDIFIRDTKTNTTIRASVNSQGTEGNGDSINPAISPLAPDGFYVIAFASRATNFGRDPIPNLPQSIIFRAPTLNLSAIVSFGVGPSMPDGESDYPSVTIIPSPNRILMAYESDATNLVNDDTNGFKDIFFATIRRPDQADSQNFPDLVTTRLISRNRDNEPSDGNSSEAVISGDGRFIVFSSIASNLLSGRSISGKQIYRYDIQKNSLSIVSEDSSDREGDRDSERPVISYNGRYVAYLTEATNLADGIITGQKALMLYDTATDTTTRLDQTASAVTGNMSAAGAFISPNGRFAIFSSDSTNLIDGDTNASSDIFIKDIETGEIARASVGVSGESDGASDSPVFGGASFNSIAAILGFRSSATNLTSDASTISGNGDIFLNRVQLPKPTLREDTQLEVPPDVLLRNKNVRLTAQDFGSVEFSDDAFSQADSTIKYEYRVKGTGAVKSEKLRRVTKRNKTTFRNLKSGTYTSRYRVVTVQNGSTVSRTPFSPRQRFTVN